MNDRGMMENEQQIEKKFCPILSVMTGQYSDCGRENCAWWIKYNAPNKPECAIAALACLADMI